MFLQPSSLCPLLHHLISFVLYSNPVSLSIHLTFLSTFSVSARHTQLCLSFYFLLFHPCPPFFSHYLWRISHHISCFHISTHLPCLFVPLCLSASASIEGPSVPIHHALHFSLLAGINHKYFIIHHGRLSPAHRQFITAALSAGLPRRL